MNIFQRLRELASGKRNYHDVATALDKLRMAGKPVSIKFEGDSRSYSSRVTAFNREHRIFVLENIFPTAQDETFRRGRVATISSTDNHQTVILKGVCLEPLVKNQNMGYEMKVRGSLTVEQFVQDFDFGLNHMPHSGSTAPDRKVVGL